MRDVGAGIKGTIHDGSFTRPGETTKSEYSNSAERTRYRVGDTLLSPQRPSPLLAQSPRFALNGNLRHQVERPPGVPAGGVWVKEKYCGDISWVMLGLTCGVCCCIKCMCPCDSRTVSSSPVAIYALTFGSDAWTYLFSNLLQKKSFFCALCSGCGAFPGQQLSSILDLSASKTVGLAVYAGDCALN